MSVRFSNTKGFTLIEIISVVTIISLISLIVLISNMTNSAELSKETDIAKSHLRYVRSMALSNDVYTWSIVFSGNYYQLKKAGTDTAFPLPGEISSKHTLPAGISTDTITITFKEGVPVDNSGVASSSDQTIQFSDGNKTETITITKNTGFVR